VNALIPPFPVYLFDVDGTLTDSAPDICAAVRQVLDPLLSARGLTVTDEFLTRFIGRHLFDLFQTLLPDLDGPVMNRLLEQYRAAYAARGHAGTQLYPGVYEAISRLNGRKSTATTKSTSTTRFVLEKFGLLAFFDHVQGTDGFPAKPAPDVIERSLAVFSAKPSDCLLVGDAPADMEAGRRAGVRIAAVTYGYGRLEELQQWEPDYWVGDLRELCSEKTT